MNIFIYLVINQIEIKTEITKRCQNEMNIFYEVKKVNKTQQSEVCSIVKVISGSSDIWPVFVNKSANLFGLLYLCNSK